MESPEEDPLALQLSLRYHPGGHAGLQLIHIDRRPDARSKLRERHRQPVRVVFLAKACLYMNADATKLVHEMPFLCDDVPKLVSYLPQTLLQRVDSFVEFHILLEKRGAEVGAGHSDIFPSRLNLATVVLEPVPKHQGQAVLARVSLAVPHVV